MSASSKDQIIKIYGDKRSGNCYKVQLVMEMLDIPYQWVAVDVLKGETRSADFLARNPNGKVPIIEYSDATVLAESNAILLHLAEDTSLLPEDWLARARVYQWLFFEQYSHEPFIAVARFIVVYLNQEQEQAERLTMLRDKATLHCRSWSITLPGSLFFRSTFRWRISHFMPIRIVLVKLVLNWPCIPISRPGSIG